MKYLVKISLLRGVIHRKLMLAIAIACLLISPGTIAQQLPPEIAWQKSLGGSKMDKANTVIRTLDNGFLVVGYSHSNDGQVTGHHGSTDSSDAWVVRLDRNGNIVWQQSYGGTRNDAFAHAIALDNGDFICVGYAESNNGDVSGLHLLGYADLWAMRINAQGNIIWSKLYGGADRDIAGVIRKAVDGGGYIIGGSSESGPGGDITNHIGWSDAWVLKINDNGVIQWQKKYGNPNHQYVHDIRILSDGNYLVSGSQIWKGQPLCSPGPPAYAIMSDFYLKLNAGGTALWETYNNIFCGVGGNNTFPSGMFELPGTGELFWLGSLLRASIDNNGTWYFRKVSVSSGQTRTAFSGALSTDFLLAPDYNNTRGTSPEASLLLPDNTVLSTTAYASSNPAPSVQASLTLLSTADAAPKRVLFQKKYGGDSLDYFKSIEAIGPSEYIAAGYSNSNNGDVSGNHGDYDFWVVKLVMRNTITGRVFVDANGNGIKDAGEDYSPNIKVTSTKGSATVASTTGTSGVFLNYVDTGTYSTTVNIPFPYYTVNPASKNSTFNLYNAKDSFDFALTPIPNKKDLRVTLTGISTVRPGFNASYQLNYLNEGTVAQSGTIKLVIPSNMNFISSVPAQASVVGDTVTWNVGPLASRAGGTISIVLKADPPPAMNFNDEMTLLGIIEPVAGDETPENNRDTLKQTVRGSFDPNDKMENLNGILQPDQVSSKYLNYTIRFQNTGTDTAFNVIIRDTLDAKLDWLSFEMVSTSHKAHTAVKNGNVLTWTFTDILLPDSNVNEAASHGYIIYRIKPKSTLVVGDTVSNSASIYFDFNLPVRTNIHQTVVKAVLLPTPLVSGVAGNYCSTQGLQKGKINNLPAPGSGITVTVKLDGNNLTIAADSTFSFDVSALAAGQHAIDVTYTNGSETKTSTNNFTVTAAVSPDVNVSANSINIANLLDPVIITASNAAGGGSNPLYTFGKDRSFTNLWQAEGNSNVLNITGADLQTGDNWIYVRMKTSAACYTTQLNIDSIKIVMQLPIPDQPVITGIRANYCTNEGTQKAKLSNYPAAGTGTTVTVRLNGTAIPLAMADTSFSFNVIAGNHVVEVTYANSTGTKTTAANFTVTAAVAPDFDLSGFSSQIVSTFPITMGAINITGGGTAPTFTFALDRNFTNILQAEGTNSNITFDPNVLKLGANKVYVRMKTSATCYTQQTAIDSVTITKYGASGIVDPDFPTQRISANPNPFKSRLLVHGINAAKVYTFTIRNQQGRKVFARKIANAASATIHLPALPAGVYALSIYDEAKDRLIGTINIAKQ